MDPGQGLTLDTSVPKGFISGLAKGSPEGSATASNSWQNRLAALTPFFVVGIPFLAVMAIMVFKRKTIIPKQLKGVPIAPYYEAPENISAADIAYFMNRSFDKSEFGVMFIDLAVKGYLKIRYLEKKGLFGSEDYELIRLKSREGLDTSYQRLFDYLFTGRDTVLMSELKDDRQTVAAIYGKIGIDLRKELEQKGFLKSGAFDVTKVKRFASLVVAIFIGVYIFRTLALIVIPIVFIVIAVAFFRNLNSFTSAGIELFRKVLGFRDFLKMTEEDRLRLLNAPSLRPEMFEKFLPYAMAFGIEKEWAKKFESLTLAPTWYEDSRYGYGTPLNALILANSLSSFTSVASAASTYSSGGGGGGFSGGGSGGGGGGSW
jgi:uncharacterized membrane protein